MRLLLTLAVLARLMAAGALPLAFERNAGQTDVQVRYLAHSSGSTLWLTEREAVLGTREGTLRIRFEGANPRPPLEPVGALPGKTSYFRGEKAERWRRDIPLFGKVRYRGLYPGTDLVFYGNPLDLEYDFVLAPHADPAQIRLVYSGAKQVRIDAAGDLVLTLGSSQIRQHKPRVYQNSGAEGTRPVQGHYVLLGRNRVGFSIGEYDRNEPLVIDPVMTYATYLGGSYGNFDAAAAVAIDKQGNLYLAGIAGSSDFPISGGLKGASPSPNPAAFVAKINPAASGSASLVWSTFLGGSKGGAALAIAVDQTGNVYLTGFTNSPDFPLQNPFQRTQGCTGSGTASCQSGWVAKLGPNGNELLYSSFLGGGVDDTGTAIAVNASGVAYVAGNTFSPLFPTGGGAYQTKLQGTGDGFLAAVSPGGESLLYSTLFGGEGTDSIAGMALDGSGLLCLGGSTTSTQFPVTQGAYQASIQGAKQAGFLSKFDLNRSGQNALVYSTYLGGKNFPSTTNVNAVAADSTGNIFATGDTTASDFPTVDGALQSIFAGAVAKDPTANIPDAFVVKVNPTAQTPAQLAYSTFLGGSSFDSGQGIGIDASGRILLAGFTASSDFPTTPDAFDCCFTGKPSRGITGFMARIDPSKSGPPGLLYGTYLGGTTGVFSMMSAALDASGTIAAVAGAARSAGAPVTLSAYQKQLAEGSGGNAYLASFDLSMQGPLITAAVNGASFQPGGFSPGLLFTITGTGLGPEVGTPLQLDASGNVATTLSQTQVLVDGVPAPLIYVSATQINAVAPYALALKTGGIVFVQVIYNNVAGNVFPVAVTDTAPAIFVGAGGQGAILNQDGSANSAGNPAPKGTYVSIFCTGEGQTNPPGVDGHVATEAFGQLARPLGSVGISIGGIQVASTDIAYAGAAPQSVAGIMQVTVKIPGNADSGSLPVVLTVGSQSSQKGVTVAVQ